MSGIVVGSVAVDVVPSAQRFWSQFQAQTRGGAAGTGRDLGSQVGAGFGNELDRVIQARLRNALGRIPPLHLGQVGVETTQAQLRLEELRRQMVTLSDHEIGVDLDAGEARTQIAEIIAELERLRTEDPTITAHANIAAAMAQLGTIEAEIGRIDGREARVEVNTGESLPRVRALVAFISGIAPVAVPAGAVATASLASIATGAVVGASGVGVLVLALSGVVGGLKNLAAVDTRTQRDMASEATKGIALAGALDQVRSARASLANTTANAAEQQRQAEIRVADAERSLARAQLDALAAQLDINDAREAGRRGLEDLDSQVARNAIAVRRAILDAQDAQKALTSALSRGVTGRPLEELQIAADDATQRLKDLRIEQGRLAVDQRAAAAAGVEGSDQVVAAQKRATDSADRVVEAQRAVVDARVAESTQARQSAYAISQAAQSVESAQRAVGRSTISAGLNGSAAMDKLQQSMMSLSPAGRDFTLYLYGMRESLLGLRRTAETGVLPGWREGIDSLMPQFGALRTFVANLSGVVGDMGRSFAVTLSSPVWSRFFGYIGQVAAPMLQVLWGAATNVATGFAGMVTAFAPVTTQVGGGLLGLTARFAAWSATLSTNRGFQEFVDYVMTRGPRVFAGISAIVDVAFTLVKALAPIGDVMIDLIRYTADVIGFLDQFPGLLTVTVGGIALVVAGLKLWALWDGAVVVAGRIKMALLPTLTAATTIYGGAVTGAAGRVGGLNQNLGAIGGAVAGARSSMAGLAGFLGGPWGVAITAATVALGVFIKGQADQKRRVDELAGSMKAYAEALRSSPESARELLAHDKAMRSLASTVKEMGVDQETLNRGILGDRDARTQVIDALNEQIAAAEAYYRATPSEGWDNGIRESWRRKEQVDDLKRMRVEFAKLNTEQAAAERAALSMSNALAEQGRSLGFTGAGADKFADAMLRAANGTLDLHTRVSGLRDAMVLLTQAGQDAENRFLSYQEASLRSSQVVSDLRANVDGLSAADLQHTLALDGKTQSAIDAQRALMAVASASRESYMADLEAGVPETEARRRLDERTNSLVKEYGQAKFNIDRVKSLVTTYGSVPSAVSTVFKQEKFPETVAGLTALIKQIAYTQYTAGAITYQEYKSKVAGADTESRKNLGVYGPYLSDIKRAEGGPVSGQGTGTSDSISARLSHGEHVWTANEVRAAGGHAVVENLRAAVLGRKTIMPEFAGGGRVELPVAVNFAKIAAGFMSSARNGLVGEGGPTVAAAQAFIRAQAGKPYIWAAAGPGGYDCSGLVSAVYNVLNRRNPYNHTFSTANEARYFPKPGFGPALTAGWAGPGERGGGRVGHTAGVLAGLRFESRGSDGVVVGSGATPVSNFAHIGHYDQGGYLPQGLSIAYNGTGQPEPVMTQRQLAALGSGGGRSILEIQNFYAADVSPGELAAELDWKMRGRG